MRKIKRQLTAIFLIFILLFHNLFALIIPVFAASNSWNFTTSTDYTYDNSKIEFISGQAQLKPPATWYSSSWLKRKPIVITGSTSGALSNYQVKVTVPFDSDMKTNFDDIRFTTSDGATSIDYWLESKTDSNSAVFWVEVPSIPASPSTITIYMYYGNSNATSASNGSNTFTFFDDFENYTVGTFTSNSKWNTYKQVSTKIEVINDGYQKFGYFNGNLDADSTYNIGAFIPDSNGLNSVKYPANPIIRPSAAGWDSAHVKDQYTLKIGDTYYLWYTGNNGSIYDGIGLATSSDGLHFTKSASNPVISADTLYDSGGVTFPSVYYDTEEVNPNKLFKMFYMCLDSTGVTNQICYAYSANGVTWTKYTNNPVVTVGSGGSWEDKWVGIPSKLVKIGSTFYMQYGGLNNATSKWQTGLLTFSNFEGTYTKSPNNPIIPRRSTVIQSLTSQTNIGTTILSVADSSLFQINEPVFLRDTGGGDELNRVVSIDSSTQITLQTAVLRNYPAGSTVRSWLVGSNTPRTMIYQDGVWKSWFTAFQPYSPSDILRESTAYATSSDGLSWTMSYTNSPLFPFGPAGSWDASSAENPSITDGTQSTPTKAMMIYSSGNDVLTRIASTGSYSNYVMEAKIKYGQQKNSWIEFRGQDYNTPNPNGYFVIKQYNNHLINQFDSGWTSGEAQAVSLKTDTYYRAVITANSNSQNFKINNLADDSNLVNRSSTYSSFASGYVGFTSYSLSANEPTETLVDWIFLRQYSSAEPSPSIGSETNIYYPSDIPSIYPNATQEFTSISGFTETSTLNGGSIKYQLSNNGGLTWYWYNSGWITTTSGFTEANSQSIINTNISSLPIGSGQFLFKAYLNSDGSQLVQLDNVEINYIIDTSPPSGGSIDYQDGYSNTNPVAITVSDGTDTESPINNSSRLVQRKTATITNGLCNVFGDFASISPTGSYPNYTDSTIVSGNCYQYRYQVSDSIGNQATYTTEKIIKIDTSAPSAPTNLSTTSPTSSNTQTWVWTAVTDTLSGIANYAYRVVSNLGVTITSGTTSTLSVITNLSSGIYDFFVKAIDNAGNESLESSSNLIVTSPTPTSAPASTSTETVSTSSVSSVCNDQTPGTKAPWLSSAIAQNSHSILLQFEPGDEPISKYILAFGTLSGDYRYGVQDMGVNSRSQMSYLVNLLSPNTTYYFKIKSQNGCTAGQWSNEISAETKGQISLNELTITKSELTPTKNDLCKNYLVKSGDNLWSIANKLLGDGNKYQELINQNQDKYPSLKKNINIKIGWELSIDCQKSETVVPEIVNNYQVKIKVLDSTQKPIEGAKVTIHSQVQEAITDKNGEAKFTQVEPGNHQVLIAYKNYKGEQSINLSGDTKNLSLEITVKPDSFYISPLGFFIIGIMFLIIISLIITIFIRRKINDSPLCLQ